ncbi:MAG: proteinral secretion pathway protein [Geobacteraceae bacterium]|nr:MAG: proteinral secretion pathway protein [Geobacteraceae bacterium]
MYCEFYGFKEKPFNITPNPRFIFLSKNHREAFAHLLYGIDNHAGFIELSGEVGTGKTTVLRALLSQLDDDSHRTALIFNPCISALELLRSINREFGIPAEGLSAAGLLDSLNRFLLTENAAGRTVVLVIDEAQNLEPGVLEQIRLISNLETETDKLIQIVLAGQPELGQLLSQPSLRQLSQRITVRYHLQPMDFEDTGAYIEHRLEIAGGWRAASFTAGAVKLIFRYAGGLPRLINIVCDRALLIGYTEESREISSRMAAAAIKEIKRGERSPAFVRRVRATGVAALIALIAAGIYAIPRDMPQKNNSSPPATAGISPDGPAASTLLDALRREHRQKTEMDSAVQAFNVLAKLWDVRPVKKYNSRNPLRELEQSATKRGLRLTVFNGSFEDLRRTDVPAVLEFSLPGLAGRRYLALTGVGNGRVFIAPPLKGHNFLTSAELESFWSGRAYLLWKNPLNIPSLAVPGTKGEGVNRLQQLLNGVGVYKGPMSGVFDRETIAAIKNFQAMRGIAADGRVGTQTLLLLYRAGNRFSFPGLEQKKGS